MCSGLPTPISQEPLRMKRSTSPIAAVLNRSGTVGKAVWNALRMAVRWSVGTIWSMTKDTSASELSSSPPHPGAQPIHIVRDQARFCHDSLTRRRQLRLTGAAAIEQRNAELMLESIDGIADGGCRTVQSSCGRRKAARLSHSQQNLNWSKLRAGAIDISKFLNELLGFIQLPISHITD